MITTMRNGRIVAYLRIFVNVGALTKTSNIEDQITPKIQPST